MRYIDLILFYRFLVEETAGNGNDLFFINDKQQVTAKPLIHYCVQLLPEMLISHGHTPDKNGI